MRRPAAAAVLLAALSGAVVTAGEAQERAPGRELPPQGVGTLRQDRVAIAIDAGAVRFLLLPLDESVIRLLAPDTYRALHALVEARRAEIDELARRRGLAQPGVMMVRVYGVEDRASFEPEDLTVLSRNRYFRPQGMLPVSPRWSEHRVAQRETETALLLYEDGLDPWAPMAVEYRGVTSLDWHESVRRLEAERARIGRRDQRHGR